MQTFTESVKEEICSNLKELVNNEFMSNDLISLYIQRHGSFR